MTDKASEYAVPVATELLKRIDAYIRWEDRALTDESPEPEGSKELLLACRAALEPAVDVEWLLLVVRKAFGDLTAEPIHPDVALQIVVPTIRAYFTQREKR